jgi:hypothetical protein
MRRTIDAILAEAHAQSVLHDMAFPGSHCCPCVPPIPVIIPDETANCLTLNVSGNFTVPNGITSVSLELWGGGGGGAAGTNVGGGGGGGAGERIPRVSLRLSVGR